MKKLLFLVTAILTTLFILKSATSKSKPNRNLASHIEVV